MDKGLGAVIPESESTPEGYFDKVFEDAPTGSGVIHKHVPQSVGLAYLDEKGKLLQYEEHIDDQIQFKFAHIVERGVRRHMTEIQERRCKNPHLTDADKQAYANTHNCQRCNALFADYGRYVKVRHHDHYIHPTLGIKGEVIGGNYLGALCMLCNISVTSKRARATCVMHNMSGYDIPLFIAGMCSDPNTQKRLTLLPKGGYGYYNVKLRKCVSFIDSYSFLPSSLADLVNLKCKGVPTRELHTVIPLTVQSVRTRYGDHMVEFVGRKQLYPYTLATSVAEMEAIVNWPENRIFSMISQGTPSVMLIGNLEKRSGMHWHCEETT